MKLAKLSLAAIMTVGALSTVNAANLEESIKGVDFTGMLRYRLNVNDEAGAAGTTNENDWDFLGKFTAPVTEDIKAVLAFASKSDVGNNQIDSSNATFNVDLAKAFFVYNKAGLTVKAGQQAIAHPIFHAGFNGSKGNGLLATYNAGPVTLAGAYFAGTNESIDNTDPTPNNPLTSDVSIKDKDIATVAVIGSMGPVDGQIWYSSIQDVVEGQVFVDLAAKIEMVNIHGQYINTDLANGGKSGDFFALKAGANFDMIGFNLGYTKNDSSQGVYAVDVDDSSVITTGWKMEGYTGNVADAETFFADVTASYSQFAFTVNYAKADVSNTADYTEMGAMLNYKASKNLNTYVRYANVETDPTVGTTDDDRFFRFEAKYSF